MATKNPNSEIAVPENSESSALGDIAKKGAGAIGTGVCLALGGMLVQGVSTLVSSALQRRAAEKAQEKKAPKKR